MPWRPRSGAGAGFPVLAFPPWDCLPLPYDRAPPSREAMGRRMATLRTLRQDADGPCILLTTPGVVLQRTPPRDVVLGAKLTLRTGDVGFGRTEVALRAAAAAAVRLAGRDDRADDRAGRQHVETFGRRFAGFGVDIGHLSRRRRTARWNGEATGWCCRAR